MEWVHFVKILEERFLQDLSVKASDTVDSTRANDRDLTCAPTSRHVRRPSSCARDVPRRPAIAATDAQRPLISKMIRMRRGNSRSIIDTP